MQHLAFRNRSQCHTALKIGNASMTEHATSVANAKYDATDLRCKTAFVQTVRIMVGNVHTCKHLTASIMETADTRFSAKSPSPGLLRKREYWSWRPAAAVIVRSLTSPIICRYISGLEDRVEKMEALLKRVSAFVLQL